VYSSGKQLLLPDHTLSPLASLASDTLLPSVNKVEDMIIKYFFNITEHNGMQSIKF
jgi:hypothetical protein